MKRVLDFLGGVHRWLTWEAWCIVAALIAFTTVAAYGHHKGVQDERDRQAAASAKTERRASTGRETAAIERVNDGASVQAQLEKRNYDAQALPDGVPDAREYRYRCSQLRDAGIHVPECG